MGLEDAARQAVRTLVPILPLDGGPKSGYVVSEHPYLRGRDGEIVAAAEAIAALWEALRGL